jgi:predicted  nucleic acid-binding Zn-ribbon protein
VKADPFDQLRLLDLQALDSALDRLAHRRRTLPELAEIERLDGLVDAMRDDVVRAETALSDLAREQDKFEREIEQVRARKTRDEERLASGVITDPKQLQDMEHEVGLAPRQGADLEDGELEVMEKVETLQGELDELTGRRDGYLAERAAAEQRRNDAFGDIDDEVARTTKERAELATSVPADLLALYEKIRANEGGVGAGAIHQGRCGGCRLDLMNNEKADLRAAAPDDVLRHDECGRIMVRTPESGL